MPVLVITEQKSNAIVRITIKFSLKRIDGKGTVEQISQVERLIVTDLTRALSYQTQLKLDGLASTTPGCQVIRTYEDQDARACAEHWSAIFSVRRETIVRCLLDISGKCRFVSRNSQVVKATL